MAGRTETPAVMQIMRHERIRRRSYQTRQAERQIVLALIEMVYNP